MECYDISKIQKIFGIDKTLFNNKLVRQGAFDDLPEPHRVINGAVKKNVWAASDLDYFGAKWGFLPHVEGKHVITVYNRKGGIYKTTLAINIARMFALHGLKVCVIGLDEQEDITKTLGPNIVLDGTENLDEAIHKFDDFKKPGLYEVYKKERKLEDVIAQSELPNLFYIPENANLLPFSHELYTTTNREVWLRKNVTTPLKEFFDVIIVDCSPYWTLTTQNAVVAADMLLSPLECKINNFRNYTYSNVVVDSFIREMGIDVARYYVPTAHSNQKLSTQIKDHYISKVPNCIPHAIKTLADGEKAMTRDISVIEHDPTCELAHEMRNIAVSVAYGLSSIDDKRKAQKH